jgi:Rod binding domain-containing protein
MAQDQLTQAVLDGGGLGLAATLYGQMAEAAGLLAAKTAKDAAGATAEEGAA